MANEPRAPYDFNRVKSFTPRDNNMSNMDKKERIATLAFIAPNPKYRKGDAYSKRYVKAIDIRLFVSRGSDGGGNVYAQVWAHSRDGTQYTRGHGSASGYGYHKESAAVDAAFSHAGVNLLSDFSGYGDEPMRIAIKTLAARLGWKTGEVMTF